MKVKFSLRPLTLDVEHARNRADRSILDVLVYRCTASRRSG
jgi:hypothetical protein